MKYDTQQNPPSFQDYKAPPMKYVIKLVQFPSKIPGFVKTYNLMNMDYTTVDNCDAALQFIVKEEAEFVAGEIGGQVFPVSLARYVVKSQNLFGNLALGEAYYYVNEIIGPDSVTWSRFPHEGIRFCLFQAQELAAQYNAQIEEIK